LNAGTITASHAINVSAGTTSNDLAAITLSNSNNITFGLNASTVTASYNFNLSAGTTSNNLNAITFSNSNGVSFGLNASTVTASFSAFTRSKFNPFMEAVAVAGQLSQGSLHIHPIPDPDNFQYDRFIMDVLGSAGAYSTNVSSGGFSYTFRVGIYTRNASTLSLLASQSTSTAFTVSSTNTSLFAGPRNLTMGWTTTMSANDLWLGVVSSSNAAGTNSFTLSNFLVSDVNSNFSGLFGVATAATAQDALGLGFYSAATNGIPNAIAFSEINGSASAALRPPVYRFLSQTA
jgi:hypothetical protein